MKQRHHIHINGLSVEGHAEWNGRLDVQFGNGRISTPRRQLANLGATHFRPWNFIRARCIDKLAVIHHKLCAKPIVLAFVVLARHKVGAILIKGHFLVPNSGSVLSKSGTLCNRNGSEFSIQFYAGGRHSLRDSKPTRSARASRRTILAPLCITNADSSNKSTRRWQWVSLNDWWKLTRSASHCFIDNKTSIELKQDGV